MPFFSRRRDSDPSNPLAELPPAAVTRLAEILSRPPRHGVDKPSHEWLASQAEQIAALPPRLGLRRTNGSSLAAFLSMDKHLLRPRLCCAHSGLDPALVHWLFGQLKWESTTHTDRIRGYRNRFPPGGGGGGGECTTDDVARFVDKISGIAALHLSPADLDRHYGGLPDDCRLAPAPAGCPACALAIVGARAELLVYLRASMLARSRRGRPRLLVLVDAWIACFGPECAAAMVGESDALAGELRRIRGVMSGRRKEKKKKKQQQQGGVGREEKRTGKSSGHRGGRPANWKTTADGSPLPQTGIRRNRRAENYEEGPEVRYSRAAAASNTEVYGNEGYYEQFFRDGEHPFEPENPFDPENQFEPGAAPGARHWLEQQQQQQMQEPAVNPFEFLEEEEKEEEQKRESMANPLDFQDCTTDASSDDDEDDNHEEPYERDDSPYECHNEPYERHDAPRPMFEPFYTQSAIPAPLNITKRGNRASDTATAKSSRDSRSWVTLTVHSTDYDEGGGGGGGGNDAGHFGARGGRGSAPPPVPPLPAEYAAHAHARHRQLTHDGGGSGTSAAAAASSSVYSQTASQPQPQRPTEPSPPSTPGIGARTPRRPVSPLTPSTLVSSARRGRRSNWEHPSVETVDGTSSSSSASTAQAGYRNPFADLLRDLEAAHALVSPGTLAERLPVGYYDRDGDGDGIGPEDSVSCVLERRQRRERELVGRAGWRGWYRED